MMVSLISEQTSFPAYLSYFLQRMGFIFRIDHDDVVAIVAPLIVALTNFCNLIIGKRPAEAVDPGIGMNSVDIVGHDWTPHFLL
jgi:hypothetical protein